MYTFHDEFAQARDLRYLNHAAVGPWPKRTAAAVQKFAEENVLLGARDYPDWMKVEQRLREYHSASITTSGYWCRST